MRFAVGVVVSSLAACVAVAGPSFAQGTAAATPSPLAAPARTSLALPAPPQGMTVQAEFHGRDDDLLGMIKGLLSGLTSPPSAPGDASAAPTSPPTGLGGPESMVLRLLSDGQLAALLKDVHEVHAVALAAPQNNGPITGDGDLAAFYEKRFQAEGGRRLVWAGPTNAPFRVLVVGFDAPRGMAAVVQMPGMAFALRTDGYPDLSIVGELARGFIGVRSGIAMPPPPPDVMATPVPAPPPPARRPAAPKPRAGKR